MNVIKRVKFNGLLYKKLVIIGVFFTQPVEAENLTDLIKKSLRTHPSITSQDSNVKSKEASVDSANWKFYPTLGVRVMGGDPTKSSIISDLKGVTAVVSLEQPIWTGGRLTSQLEVTKANLEGANSSLDQERRDITLRVIEAYGEWLLSHLKTKAWEESLETHLRLKESVKRRVKEGASSTSDALLAKSRFESVVAELAAIHAQEMMTLSTLSHLVGEEVTGNSLDISLKSPKLANSMLQMIDSALELSPSILKAQSQSDEEKAKLSVQKSNRWPEIFARAEYQVGTVNDGINNSNTEARIFFGVRTNFGAGLSIISDSESLHASHQSSLATIETQQRLIKEQVQSQHYLLASFSAQLKALKITVEATEGVFKSYDRQFFAGRKTWFDVLNSARDLVQSKIQLADAEAASFVVKWRLAVLTQDLENLLGIDAKKGT